MPTHLFARALFKEFPVLRRLAVALVADEPPAARPTATAARPDPVPEATAAPTPRPAAPTSDVPPDRCVIIPHASPRPGSLAIDLHSAVLAVLQRPAHRDDVDLRDPMDVVVIRRDGPAGATYATVVRWYAPGERSMEDLMAPPVELPEIPADAVPRMDAGVAYQPATAKGPGR